MTHKQRGRMRSSAVLRDFIHIGSVHVVYSVVNALATIASVVGYIQGTYYEQDNTPTPKYEKHFQDSLLVWFAIVFAFELFIAYDRMVHLKKLVTICDFLSVLPILTLILSSFGVRGDTLAFLSIFRAFRVLRFLRLHRLLSFYSPGMMRQVIALLLIIFCALFVLTGCVYQLESLPDIDGMSQFTERLSFFEAFYFVIITFTTVGYGDIYPQQIISRIIVAAAVPVMIIVVPTLGSQIYDLVAAQSQYACPGKIHTHGDWHHIVVVGDLGADETTLGRQLPVLLEQLYHPERGSVDIELQVVLLQNEDPPITVLNRVLQHPYYSERVQWVTGSAFEDAHLRHWVAGDRAVCFINLANDEVPSIHAKQREDNAAVQRSLVIRRTFPKVRLITQLLLERNLHRLHGERCELVCVEQLKYAMLGRSVCVPALHTLLAGLLVAGAGKKIQGGAAGFDSISRTFSEELTRALDVSYVPQTRAPNVKTLAEDAARSTYDFFFKKQDAFGSAAFMKSNEQWDPLTAEEEQATGVHATVHEVSAIPAETVGMRFDEVARLAYLHFGVLPVAVSTCCSLVTSPAATAADVGSSGPSGPSGPSVRAPRTSVPWVITLDSPGAGHSKTRGSAHVVNFPYDYCLQTGDTLLVIANDTEAVNAFETWDDFELRERCLDAVWDTKLFPQAAHQRSASETDKAETEFRLKQALETSVDDYEAALQRLSFRAHLKISKSHTNLQLGQPAVPPRSSAALQGIDPAGGGAPDASSGRGGDDDLGGGDDRGDATKAEDKMELSEGTAQVAMAQCAELEQWSEVERLAYLRGWFENHVCAEAPRDLEGHVVFCGTIHSLMCFLQPLMYANIEWNATHPDKKRSLPSVVVLDPLLDPKVLSTAGKGTFDGFQEHHRFETCTFYDPVADGPPNRLWIVPGDPRESRCHAGHPAPLERVRIDRAEVFVMPNSQMPTDIENLGGDDFTVRVVRNVQETVSRARGEPLGRGYRYVEHYRPRLLVEMHNSANATYLRNSPPYNQLETSGQIVLPTFVESAVVNVYHSSAALPFTLHAMCSWRDDGLLHHERLRDGIVRESCHISLVDIPKSFHGERYLKFFDYCNAHAALAVGLYRVPHGATDRDLPYVYTTPRPYDFIHDGDRAFVLATSVWFGDNGDVHEADEAELQACVKSKTRRKSAMLLPTAKIFEELDDDDDIDAPAEITRAPLEVDRASGSPADSEAAH